jgi:hypothetical protein
MGEFMRDQWDDPIQSIKLIKRQYAVHAHWGKELCQALELGRLNRIQGDAEVVEVEAAENVELEDLTV